MEKITCLAFSSLQFTMNTLKLSIILLDRLGHIQVNHADISRMENFQGFNANKRNKRAAWGRYPNLQLERQGGERQRAWKKACGTTVTFCAWSGSRSFPDMFLSGSWISELQGGKADESSLWESLVLGSRRIWNNNCVFFLLRSDFIQPFLSSFRHSMFSLWSCLFCFVWELMLQRYEVASGKGKCEKVT